MARLRSHLTLGLCTIMHAFTHAYGVLLVPLYLMMKSDLHLGGVKAATLIVTLYGLVYNAGSYGAGLLADRFDRRMLLGIGLIGNAAAILGMGLTHDYLCLLGLAIFAGLSGTLFHPAANALVPAHYPKNPGLAIGLLGMGSGLGFFSGPQFAGWRAKTAAWNLWHISQWQKPCIELGLAGLVFAILFILVAREAPGNPRTVRPPLPPRLRRKVVLLACVLGWRDFAGVAAITLASLYLQRACHRDEQAAGLIIGLMMLAGFGVNPLAVWLSPGRRRLPILTLFLIAGGVMSMTVPHFSVGLALIPLAVFQTLQMGSYALSDSAMLERVDPDLRGRVVGIFLSIAGTLGALSPWWMGWWVDRLGARASLPSGYDGPYAVLGLMMMAAAFAPLILRRLGPVQGAPSPLAEITPETMETVL